MKKILIAVLIIFTLLLFSFCGNVDDENVQNDDTQATSISETEAPAPELTDEANTEETIPAPTEEFTETTVENTTAEENTVIVAPTETPTELPTAAPATTTTAALTEAPAEDPVVSTAKAETTVWIPNSGSKYHRSASCSNMKNPSQVTLEKAQSWGYTPCKKCY